MRGLSTKLKEEINTTASDVRRHWEQYSGEAMLACRKLTEKLEGKIIRFKSLGRPEMRGRIEQVSDHLGIVTFWVIIIPKRGGAGSGKEVYLSDIKAFE